MAASGLRNLASRCREGRCRCLSCGTRRGRRRVDVEVLGRWRATAGRGTPGVGRRRRRGGRGHPPRGRKRWLATSGITSPPSSLSLEEAVVGRLEGLHVSPGQASPAAAAAVPGAISENGKEEEAGAEPNSQAKSEALVAVARFFAGGRWRGWRRQLSLHRRGLRRRHDQGRTGVFGGMVEGEWRNGAELSLSAPLGFLADQGGRVPPRTQSKSSPAD